MKSLNKFLFLIYIILFIPNVYASECSNAEKVSLGKEAVGVKVGYEEAVGVMDKDKYTPPEGVDPDTYELEYYYFKINIFNVSKNLKVEITNDVNDKVIVVTNDMLVDNAYSFDWKGILNPTTIKYKILSATPTCENYKLKTGVISLPAYNQYHSHAKCAGREKLGVCQKFTYTKVTSKIFEKEIQKVLNKENTKVESENQKNDNLITKLSDYIKQNTTMVIIISITLTSIIGSCIVVIVRKRRRRVI